MSSSNLTAEEWLAFFEQPDVLAMCRTIAAHPHDLTPRYIWLDWLDEHSPDPELPRLLREHVDSESEIGIEGLSQAFDLDLKPWYGRLKVSHRENRFTQERLCCSGIVGFSDIRDLYLIPRLLKWPINGMRLTRVNSYGWDRLSRLAWMRFLASEHLPQLIRLELGYNNIQSDEARELANASHLTNLTSLSIYNDSLGDPEVAIFANAANFSKLEILNLVQNRIGPEGVIS
jgi:uncharacterized protein (TIGR02996 family)